MGYLTVIDLHPKYSTSSESYNKELNSIYSCTVRDCIIEIRSDESIQSIPSHSRVTEIVLVKVQHLPQVPRVISRIKRKVFRIEGKACWHKRGKA
jgi:hypothetical protein